MATYKTSYERLVYEKVPFTGADISESNDSKDKIRQQAKSILDKIKYHQEEEESIPEWMEGFDDLVCSNCKMSHGDYMVLNKLSDEQKIFLQSEVLTMTDDTFLHQSHKYVEWDSVCGEFRGWICGGVFGKEIFFNDLFIPKS